MSGDARVVAHIRPGWLLENGPKVTRTYAGEGARFEPAPEPDDLWGPENDEVAWLDIYREDGLEPVY